MDLELDIHTHDLVLKNGDLVLIKKAPLVAQRIKQRLLFFFGEWFLAVDQGVPYFTSILVKNADIRLVESIFKSTIVETEDVKNLLEFEFEYDNIHRKIFVKFKVDTVYGQLSDEVIL